MKLEEAKKLISENNINKDNSLDAILSFEYNTIEENFIPFCNLVFESSCYWEFGYAQRILKLLDSFEKAISKTLKNTYNLLICRASVYLYSKDAIRAIETCFKIRDLKDVPNDILFMASSTIVNALYDNKEFNYALEENTLLYNSLVFSNLNNSNKIIVLANNALLYTSLSNYEKASWYFNEGKTLLNECSDKEDLEEEFELIKIFMAFKFSDKYFNSTFFEQNISELEKKINGTSNIRMYENISIYEEIFDILIESGKKDLVFKICQKFLGLAFNVYDKVSIYRYLLLSINKKLNYELYVSYLEKYIKLLEEEKTQDRYLVSNYYVQTSKYYNQKERYTHDPLTLCLSRGIFEDKKLLKDKLGLIYLDLNNLKKVNDLNGHSFGDNYLKTFASNLLTVFSNDEVYRVGGDEFIVCLSEFDKENIIDKLNKLNEMPLYDTKKNDKFSSGIVKNNNNLTIQELSLIADKALYDSKKSKDQFYVFAN